MANRKLNVLTKYLVLLCVFFLLSPLASYASSDSTPPTFKNLELSATSVQGGNSIKVYISAEDDISGVNYVEISAVSPSGQTVYAGLYNTEELGRWQGDIKISQYAEAGEWKIKTIYITDAANSYWARSYYDTYVYEHDSAGNSQKIFDMNPITFTVENSSSDLTPPTFKNIELSATLVQAGNSIKVYVSAEDDIAGVNYVEISAVSPSGQTVYAGLYNKDELGRWQGDIKISQYAEAGEWKIKTIYITDAANSYWARSYYDTYVYEHDSAGNSQKIFDMNPITFSVTNEPPDKTAPTVTIISPLTMRVTNDNTAILDFSVSDGRVSVYIDGVKVEKESGQELDTLLDGFHTVRVESTDDAGNIGYSVVTFTVDTVIPDVTASSLGGTYNSAQTVSLVANEDSIIYYTTDGNDPTNQSSIYSKPISINQTAILKYFAVDLAGNQSKVNVQKYDVIYPTSISNNGPIVARKKSLVTLSASLAVSNEGDVKLVGNEITFVIGSQTVSAFTDVNGFASVTLLLDQKKEIYPYTIKFEGNTDLLASEYSGTFQILTAKQLKK